MSSTTGYKELTMTITSTQGEGYGFELDGYQSPLRVSAVSKGSPSHRAGLCKGDYLLTVNGHTVKDSPLPTVQSIISYAIGSPLTMKIARPTTAKQNRPSHKGQDFMHSSESSRLHVYQQAIGDAVRSAKDALDLLGPLPKVTEERSEVEVAVNLENYSDQSSPPPSSPDQSDPEEDDPLMDFSKGSDQYTYQNQEHLSAAMVGGVIRAQQALQGIKNISENAANSKKQKETSPQTNQQKFSTEASIQLSSKKPKSFEKDSKKSEVDTPPAVPSLDTPPTVPSLDTPPTVPSLDTPPTVPSLDTPPTIPSLDTPPTVPSLDTPPTIPPLDMPPPIPPYNPGTPDSFLLSNRPEYQLDLKKSKHSYEDVSLDKPSSETSPSGGVVLRTKKHSKSSTPPTFDQATPTSPAATKTFPKKVPPAVACEPKQQGPSISMSALDPLKASRGLPSSVHSWKSDHVLQWFNQLNETLSEIYKKCFIEHSITGHTLLHLNQNKLLSMGITNKEHRMQIGMSIARLRLHHEQKELEKLSNHVSWL